MPSRVLGDLSVHLRRVAALKKLTSRHPNQQQAKQRKPPPEPPPGRPFRSAEGSKEGSRRKKDTSAQGEGQA